jgi:hypothetical protein
MVGDEVSMSLGAMAGSVGDARQSEVLQRRY